MSGFLYFLPSAKPDDILNRLDLWGLQYLTDGDHRLHSRGCTGPGGVHGMIVGSSANFTAEEVKVRSDIDWHPFPKPFAERQAHLGVIESMPKPADLIRQKTISGEFLTLADGNRWLIPHAQVITANGPCVNLPVSFDLDEQTGDWIARQVMAQYRPLWNAASSYQLAMSTAISESSDEGPVTFEIPDGQKLVEVALQANYRVSIREMAVLGLLETNLIKQVADIIINLSGYELRKKKEELNTGDG